MDRIHFKRKASSKDVNLKKRKNSEYHCVADILNSKDWGMGKATIDVAMDELDDLIMLKVKEFLKDDSIDQNVSKLREEFQKIAAKQVNNAKLIHQAEKQLFDAKVIIESLNENIINFNNLIQHGKPSRVITRSVGLQVCTVGTVNMSTSRKKELASVLQLLNPPSPVCIGIAEKPKTDKIESAASSSSQGTTPTVSREESNTSSNRKQQTATVRTTEVRTKASSSPHNVINSTSKADSSQHVFTKTFPGLTSPKACGLTSTKSTAVSQSMIKGNRSSSKVEAREVEEDFLGFEEILPAFPPTPNYASTVRRPPTPSLSVEPYPQSLGSEFEMLVSWTFINTDYDMNNIKEYHLYSLREIIHEGISKKEEEWMLATNIKASRLPIKCGICQDIKAQKYYFIIRAVDNNEVVGEFSQPECISLVKHL